jgi:glutathione S-transferase
VVGHSVRRPGMIECLSPKYIDKEAELLFIMKHQTYLSIVKMLMANADENKNGIEKARKEASLFIPFMNAYWHVPIIKVVRQLTVIDGHLAEKDHLVGNKVTLADISFIPWNRALGFVLGDTEYAKEVDKLENFKRWNEAVSEYPSVKRALELKDAPAE